MIEVLSYIIPGLIALIGNYFLSNFRLNKLENDIKEYKNINERLARIETKLDYITSK
jgi:hypothetical protein